MNPNECQFSSLKTIADGKDKTPPMSMKIRLTFALRRHLSPKQDRFLHKKANSIIDYFSKRKIQNSDSVKTVAEVKTIPLKAGDLVRVKSKEEIQATLNHLRQTKGLTFGVGLPYCGTVQRVLKTMERFVDERDLKMKKCKGLVLLENVMCEGTEIFGRCDRCCFIFWREEWLEKIEEPVPVAKD